MQTTITPWDEWIAAYTEHAEQRGRRPRGIASYRKVLTHLARFAGEQPLSPDLVADFLHSRAISPTTKLYEITVIGRWAAYLRRRGWLDVDILAVVDKPRRRRVAPLSAPRADVAAVARWIDEGEGHERDRRFAALCLYGGLRISEAAACSWAAVDLELGELIVYEGKGGDDRTITIAPPLRRRLEAVPAELRRGAVAGKADGGHLTHKSASHIFERVIPREVGVELSAHMLRRAFATRLDELGKSVRVIQELLGHADLSTTARYIGIDRRRKGDATDSLDGAF